MCSNAAMNLKLVLLVRMTLVGLLCWVGVSAYVVATSGHRTVDALERIAHQVGKQVAVDLQRQLTVPARGLGTPDLAGVAAQFVDPMCLRYTSGSAAEISQGCHAGTGTAEVPAWFRGVAALLGPVDATRAVAVGLWGQALGTLHIAPNPVRLLERQWQTSADLLVLTAVTLLALELMALLVVSDALRPTHGILAALENLGDGKPPALRLEGRQAREFRLIARGIDQLADRLRRLSATRSELTARLIQVQDAEQREIAQELHNDLGQCIAAVGAAGFGLRQDLDAAPGVPPQLHEGLDALDGAVERTRVALRHLLLRVRPPLLGQQSLLSSINDLITGWQARPGSAPHTTTITLDAGDLDAWQPSMAQAQCLYRLVQEGLANAARHAADCQAVQIRIALRDGGLHVRIANDVGDGASASATAAGNPGTGMGLRLLAERLQAVRGRLSVERGAAAFVLQADLPAAA